MSAKKFKIFIESGYCSCGKAKVRVNGEEVDRCQHENPGILYGNRQFSIDVPQDIANKIVRAYMLGEEI